jgi:hypothetical protein
MKTSSLLFSLAGTIWMLLVTSNRGAEAPAQAENDLRKPLSQLHFQTGEVLLPGGPAKLNLPETFQHLPPVDAEVVLTPRNSLSLGLSPWWP